MSMTHRMENARRPSMGRKLDSGTLNNRRTLSRGAKGVKRRFTLRSRMESIIRKAWRLSCPARFVRSSLLNGHRAPCQRPTLLIALAVAAFAMGGAWASVWASSIDDGPRSRILATYARGLEFLAAQQHADGEFPTYHWPM